MVNSGQTYRCIIFPLRTIKVLRTFNKKQGEPYFDFRPNGYVVQGYASGRIDGGPYEITEESLISGFDRSVFGFFQRLSRLRVKIYYK